MAVAGGPVKGHGAVTWRRERSGVRAELRRAPARAKERRAHGHAQRARNASCLIAPGAAAHAGDKDKDRARLPEPPGPSAHPSLRPEARKVGSLVRV